VTPTVVANGASAGLIDPLKHSRPTGAALAFNGLQGCLPLMHGSKGCASFTKALFTQHYREPIPLQGTGVDEVTAVLGASDLLTATLDAVIAKHRPALIGLCTTGLTETNGEDMVGELQVWRQARSDEAPPVVFVSTPDFDGGLSDGYGATVAALIHQLAEPGPAVPGRVAVLPGPTLGPLDVEAVTELVASFDLAPVVVPDLSATLDGHLGDNWSALPQGGTTVDDVAATGRAQAGIGIGEAMRPAIDALTAIGPPASVFPHPSGLQASDALVAELASLSGRSVPASLRRWRRRLTDGLIDAHFVLGGRRVALALEPDLLVAVSGLLAEVGAEVVTAVAPQRAPVLEQASCDEVAIGGFATVEERAAEAGAELLVASSHGRRVADSLGLAHVRLGFPITDRLGAGQQLTTGYRGSLALITRMANTWLGHEAQHHHHAQHHAHHGPPAPDQASITRPTDHLEEAHPC
jgi:nitrogenase molybdenum-iron protein NifN